tara:strand:+ start:225 stop:503 length:279 start_codon:yes stop_codon:yes gene_type:complete
MIKKIIDNIADDKKDHVLLGIAIGYPLMTLGYIIDLLYTSGCFVPLGAVIAILFVAGKEVVYDKILGKGNPEWLDFIASAIPIVFPLLCYIA